MADRYAHKCADPECIYYGQYTSANQCECHKSANQLHAQLVSLAHEARRAIGDHSAPADCYATGPLTGDDYRDLVECPACSFIAKYVALKLSGA